MVKEMVIQYETGLSRSFLFMLLNFALHQGCRWEIIIFWSLFFTCLRSVHIFFAGMACSDNSSANFHCKISASKIPTGNTCSGQLLFEDDFDIFDLEKWHHEVSASGGRVRHLFICYSCVLQSGAFEEEEMMVMIITIKFFILACRIKSQMANCRYSTEQYSNKRNQNNSKQFIMRVM